MLAVANCVSVAGIPNAFQLRSPAGRPVAMVATAAPEKVAEMLCQQLMKREVACLSTGESVRDAAARMREDNIGFLPVCDETGRVVGTVTDRDLAIRVLAENLPTSTPVEDVMTRDVVSCAPTDDVHRAEQLMGKYRKSRIICVDVQGKPVGVISLSDIVHYETSEQAARTMRRITQREVHP